MSEQQTIIKTRPLLMRGELVQASLADLKTVTRRVIKPQPVHVSNPYAGLDLWTTESGVGWNNGDVPPRVYLGTCPQGRPGDRIWLKETFWQYGRHEPATYVDGRKGWAFCAGNPDRINVRFEAPGPEFTPADRWSYGYHKRPSLFMERWMSRLLVEITEVRAERLQSISHDDCCRELGAPLAWPGPGPEPYRRDVIGMFRDLWDKINAKRGFGWETNPWVFAIGYRRLDARNG